MIHMNRALFFVHHIGLNSIHHDFVNFHMLFFCSIISHKSLKVQDEDSLYELIKKQYCVDSRYSHLFEIVRFEYLSAKPMFSFIELINKSFQVLAFAVWEALNRRLSLPIFPAFRNDRIHDMLNSICCSFVEGSPLNGIISYLTRKCGGHICVRGIVSINASSVAEPQSYPLRNVAYFENQTGFYPKNEPAHYSLRSRRDSNSYHLRCWTLEGSQDGKSWVELDHRENNATLNSPDAIATFFISQSIEV
jgi:hypothetical protein